MSPLNQASAYATFANDGTAVADHVVKEVQDADGKVLYKADPKEKRAMPEDIAHDVTFALSNVVENGTGRSVQTLNRPVAGKTGTNGVPDKNGNNIVNSAWFVGYTRQISTAVMYVRGDEGTGSLDDYRRPGDNTFFGGTYPALTWEEYMKTATDGQSVKDFPDPAYVNADSAPQPSQTYQAPSPTQRPSSSEAPSPTPSRSPSASAPPPGSGSPRPSSSSSPRPRASARGGG